MVQCDFNPVCERDIDILIAEAFATDVYGRNIWGCPSDSNADFAWLQHLVKSMDSKTGRCTVILPQGVLFHGGKEGEIRKQLIESDKLEAVLNTKKELASNVNFTLSIEVMLMNIKEKTI